MASSLAHYGSNIWILPCKRVRSRSDKVQVCWRLELTSSWYCCLTPSGLLVPFSSDPVLTAESTMNSIFLPSDSSSRTYLLQIGILGGFHP